MGFGLLLFFSSLLFLFNFGINSLNEEFIVFSVLVLIFYYLYVSLKKFIKFQLFYKVEYAYFVFLYLLKFNLYLISSFLKLLNILEFKIFNDNIFNIYNYFLTSLKNNYNKRYVVASNFLRNFVLIFNLNVNTFLFNFVIENFYFIFLRLSINYSFIPNVESINYNRNLVWTLSS